MRSKLHDRMLPNHMCERIDRWTDVGEELIDHLSVFWEKDCTYARVEMRRIRDLADAGLNRMKRTKE